MRLKTLLIFAVLLTGVLFPPANMDCSFLLAAIISALSFSGGIILSLVVPYGSLHNNLEISAPKWPDKLNTKRPLIFYQLLAFLTISYGVGSLTGELIQTHTMNFTGLFSLTMGLGILTGIYLALWRRVQ